MKLLPNINKSVPEAADPALIKPVSDALEALDTALGAAPSTLTTTAKTLVGAINEVDGDFVKTGNLQSITDIFDLQPGTYACNNSNGWALRPSGSGVYGVLLVNKVQEYYFIVYADSLGDVYHGFFSVYQNIIWRKLTSTTV